ncbi:DNA repair protein RadA [Rhabdothermincola salaria]|uniref:DNA repair protein RadA n=1 Tax=Rhabdothermincola salaria TaxID=2903142 RepID=UPI001E2A3D8C|nr:DNA repair protein RadA [Rhabdothermincola salaria]MCD9624670.1 DNA repair protein RadA [Rhabdothermincola salaria]
MAKARSVFRCQDCGGTAPKWVGRCPTCEAWNTLVEERVVPAAGGADAGTLSPPAVPLPISEVDVDQWVVRPTGVGELDRVLGGGLVPGSVTLLGGEPGIGKSTLLLQAMAAVAAGGTTVLYVSAEESTQQVRMRAERLGTLTPSLYLASETALPHIIGFLDELSPELLVVDSIQTVFDPELGSAPGSVGQVRECAARLVGEAKRRGLATVLVGHVTKEGGLAGPRVLEHVVDTVLAFEGERHHALRLLRAVKHRFGPTDQLGLFEMTGDGMVGVPDPSRLFLADRRQGVSGSVVVPTIEGHRPLLVELQALVTPSSLPSPRRSAQGVDNGRLSLLIAVLAERSGLRLAEFDVYALAVGGVKVVEPGADLGLALALASALTGEAVPAGLVVCGEVGLGGELRQVSQSDRRLAEAARLGFHRAIVPRLAPDGDGSIELVRVETLAEAVAAAGLLPAGGSSPSPSVPAGRSVPSPDEPF